MTVAESEAELPPIWVDRVNRIAESPSKTYVAALGTALLAKATDPSVDALTVKTKAGPNAYSMRGVAKVLVEGASLYGFHLGRTGPEPLNNQPWFGVDRVDKIDNLKADALPYHRNMVRYLNDLNGYTAEEAFQALAVFFAYDSRSRLSITANTRWCSRRGGSQTSSTFLTAFSLRTPKVAGAGKHLWLRCSTWLTRTCSSRR